MCLPGTVESVRDACERGEVPRLSRRAALAGGGAAAVAALLPAGAGADGRRGKRHGDKVADLTHVFRAGFPVYVGATPTRRTIDTIPVNGFYAQAWDVRRALGHAHGRAGALRRRRAAHARSRSARAVRADRRDRRRAARGERPRHGRRRGGHPPLRAPLRADRARHGGPDALGLGPQGGRPRRVLERRRRRAVPLPGLRRRRRRPADQARGRARSASTRSASTPATRRRSPLTSTGSAPTATGSRTSTTSRAIPPRGATLIVGVIPWEEGSGGPCRLLARY